MAPLGGVERALGKVRFARLIHSGARVLGGPAVRAASGGNLSLPWLPLRVMPYEQAGGGHVPPPDVDVAARPRQAGTTDTELLPMLAT
jgi:hypothetical protein